MVTRDVFKVLKLHSPTARAILRTFKTSLVPINHEMHSRSYDFLYIYHDGLATENFLIALSNYPGFKKNWYKSALTTLSGR